MTIDQLLEAADAKFRYTLTRTEAGCVSLYCEEQKLNRTFAGMREALLWLLDQPVKRVIPARPSQLTIEDYAIVKGARTYGIYRRGLPLAASASYDGASKTILRDIERNEGERRTWETAYREYIRVHLEGVDFVYAAK